MEIVSQLILLIQFFKLKRARATPKGDTNDMLIIRIDSDEKKKFWGNRFYYLYNFIYFFYTCTIYLYLSKDQRNDEDKCIEEFLNSS